MKSTLLANEFKVAKLKELIHESDSYIITNNDLRGNSYFRSILESSFENQIITYRHASYDNISFSIKDSPPKTLSATDLCDLVECPRKYYAKRRENLEHIIENHDLIPIQPYDIGNIVHTCLKEIYKNQRPQIFLDNIIKGHLEKKGLSLSMAECLHKEIVEYIINAKQMANEIIQKYSIEEVFVEQENTKEIFDISLKGKIDLWGLNKERSHCLIIDFKRNTKKMNKSPESFLQLSFYRYLLIQKNLIQKNTPCTLCFIPYDNDVQKKVLSLEVDNMFKQKHLKYDLFEDIENKILKFKNMTIYETNPQKISSCNYCPLELICPKKP